MKTRARVVVQPEQDGPLSIVEATVPDPGPHQVRVKLLATGLCQSQIWWLHQPRQAPVLFGHEGYGVATAVGGSVRGIAEGDPVLVTWVPRQAPDGRAPEAAALELDDGSVARSANVYTWAEHCLADALYVKPIRGRPDDPALSIVGCAVITGAGSVIGAGAVKRGDSVAVFGVGGVGLSAVAAARVVGAGRIVAVDVDSAKLALAKRFGATDGVDSRDGPPSDAILRMKPLRCGCHPGVDVALDCVAIPDVTRQALASVRAGRLGIERGGRCVLVGIPKQPLELDTLSMLMKEQTLAAALAGSCAQERIDDFLDWHRDGLLDLSALVTDRFRFDEIPIAADALARGKIAGRAIALT